MLSYSLSDQVHAALRGEDLVLLDVAVGRYFCVPAAACGLRLLQASSEVEIIGPDLAEALVGAGFVSRSAAASPRPVLPEPAQRQARRRPPGDGSSIPLVAAVLWLAAREYHGRSFVQLVNIAAARRSGQGRADLGLAEELAGHFARALPWIPFQGDCLYRSFVLQALLAKRDVSATWVFGVQTWPFEAHCWLQVEDMVLDDTCDHVRGFTPILAV